MYFAQSIEGVALEKADAGRVVSSKLKRGMDVALAGVALVFFLPLLISIAFAIRMTSPGPALFRQQRGGLDGTTFTILKFRTMAVMTEPQTTQQATRNDPRITTIGAFLRRSSLDELPQLINVLKGEMSIVGPRPHALDHDEYYGRLLPQYALRSAVKPGLTGLAQVEGFRGETSQISQMAQRVSQDLMYIKAWSIGLDVKLILRSIAVPFGGRAY